MENELDKSSLVETTLLDLSKAYDGLPYGLLIAKFESYDRIKPFTKLLNKSKTVYKSTFLM